MSKATYGYDVWSDVAVMVDMIKSREERAILRWYNYRSLNCHRSIGIMLIVKVRDIKG